MSDTFKQHMYFTFTPWAANSNTDNQRISKYNHVAAQF